MQSSSVTRLGLGLTAFYLFFLGIYACVQWTQMLEMKPNEFGDFLAGAFGPLAIFWLICGYFQQGIELKQNTEALILQAQELKHSTRALDLQVEELKRSVEQQSRMAELAAEQLQLEVRKGRRAEDKELAQYKPIFDIAKSEMYVSVAPAIGQITIINSGASVVVNKIISNFKPDALPSIEGWSTGESYSFLPRRKDRPSDLPVDISIHYRQANGVQGKLKISMECLGVEGFGPPVVNIAAV